MTHRPALDASSTLVVLPVLSLHASTGCAAPAVAAASPAPASTSVEVAAPEREHERERAGSSTEPVGPCETRVT